VVGCFGGQDAAWDAVEALGPDAENLDQPALAQAREPVAPDDEVIVQLDPVLSTYSAEPSAAA